MPQHITATSALIRKGHITAFDLHCHPSIQDRSLCHKASCGRHTKHYAAQISCVAGWFSFLKILACPKTFRKYVKPFFCNGRHIGVAHVVN